MQQIPPIAAMITKGSRKAKIMRQPKAPTIAPPIAGPIAGPRAIVIVAKPMIVAVFFAGTCSMMIFDIIGIAMPVPIPCSMRPAMRTGKFGDHMPRSVPAAKNKTAAAKICLVRKHFFNQDEVGMMIASISRLIVVTHCTVEVVIPNSFIRVGKMTFIAVSAQTPVKVRSPVAMTEMITRLSSRRSKAEIDMESVFLL